MASRPRGFGLTAELQRKADAKYDDQCELEARQWIEAVLGEQVFGGQTGADAMHDILKDGIILNNLANKLGGNLKPNTTKMAFKQMENIGSFLTFCQDQLGVQKSDLFQTVDLYEKQNMNNVIMTIHAVGRRCNTLGLSVPSLGPKEATAQPREWSEEQLKEGQNIIGLQMGSNKGASQAGDHFGRPRQVAGANVYK